jgi:hypothetical protein
MMWGVRAALGHPKSKCHKGVALPLPPPPNTHTLLCQVYLPMYPDMYTVTEKTVATARPGVIVADVTAVAAMDVAREAKLPLVVYSPVDIATLGEVRARWLGLSWGKWVGAGAEGGVHRATPVALRRTL